MGVDTETLYHQAADKQRIVIIGNQARVITAMIAHALTLRGRKFDLVRNGELSGSQSVKDSGAPVLIIEEGRKPYANLLEFHHHIGIISDLDNSPELIANVTRFADASPKAGMLIYSDRGPSAAIGKPPRTDVTAIAYGPYESKTDQGKLVLITSTGERFPVKFSGEDHLRSVSAAKELLKKTGISSGQFYEAMKSFELPAA